MATRNVPEKLSYKLLYQNLTFIGKYLLLYLNLWQVNSLSDSAVKNNI